MASDTTNLRQHLATLKELQDRVFGAKVGDEPNVYATGTYEAFCDLAKRSRKALAAIDAHLNARGDA